MKRELKTIQNPYPILQPVKRSQFLCIKCKDRSGVRIYVIIFSSAAYIVNFNHQDYNVLYLQQDKQERYDVHF